MTKADAYSNFHKYDLRDTTFLITGGAGFIGSNLVKYILANSGARIRVLDNFSTGHEENLSSVASNPRLEIIEGDIADYPVCMRACKDVDYISHQAALGSVPRSIKYPLETNRSNVDGFINVMTAARESKVKRMVYASSSSVYGDSEELPKMEGNIGTPLSPYAVSKRTNELYAHVAWKTYGQQLIGLRYFNVFGPFQDPAGAYAAVIPLFITSLLQNKAPFINGDGNQSRDFTYVENAVQANMLAMLCEDQKAFGESFNIALGERITINQLFEILKEITGADVAAFHRDAREGDIAHSHAAIEKARKILNYDPQVKVQEGLKKTVEWFKNHWTV